MPPQKQLNPWFVFLVPLILGILSGFLGSSLQVGAHINRVETTEQEINRLRDEVKNNATKDDVDLIRQDIRHLASRVDQFLR